MLFLSAMRPFPGKLQRLDLLGHAGWKWQIARINDLDSRLTGDARAHRDKLIKLHQTADRIVRGTVKERARRWPEYEKIVDEINNIVSRYSVVTKFYPAEDGVREIPFIHPITPDTSEEEVELIETLLDICEDGDSGRLCRCAEPECQRWFYKIVPRQKFCSNLCKQKFNSRSEEFKKERKLYMRVYRKIRKEKEEAEDLARRAREGW